MCTQTDARHTSTSYITQAPSPEKDMHDRRRCGLSVFLTMAAMVKGDIVSPIPWMVLLGMLYIALARGVLIPH